MKAAQIEAIKSAVVEFDPIKSVLEFKKAVNNGMTVVAKESESDIKYVESKIEAASRQAKQLVASGNKSTTAVNALCSTVEMFVGELIKQDVMTQEGLKAVNKENSRFIELANTITKIKSEGTADMTTTTTATETKTTETKKSATAKPAAKKTTVAKTTTKAASQAEKPVLKKVETVEVAQEQTVVEKKDKSGKKFKRTPVDLGNTMRGIKKFLATDLVEEVRKDDAFMQNLNGQVDTLIMSADALNTEFNAEKYEDLKAAYNVMVDYVTSHNGLDLLGQFTLKSLATAFQVMDTKKVKFQAVKADEVGVTQLIAEPAANVVLVEKEDVLRGSLLIEAVKFFERYAEVAKEKITVHVKVKKLGINTKKAHYKVEPEVLVEQIDQNAIAVVEAMYRINAAYKDAELKKHLRNALEVIVSDKDYTVFEKEEVKLAKKLLKDGLDKEASFKKVSKKGSWIETNILHPVYGVMDDFVGAVGMLAKAGFVGLTTVTPRTLRQEVHKINTNYKTATGGLWKNLISW